MVGAFVGDGISIHALRKESDQAADHVGHQLHISIHALRKESDIQARESAITAYEFQSTLSRKESDPAFYWNAKSQEISIHALRKESDFACAGILPLHPYFNPRSP